MIGWQPQHSVFTRIMPFLAVAWGVGIGVVAQVYEVRGIWLPLIGIAGLLAMIAYVVVKREKRSP